MQEGKFKFKEKERVAREVPKTELRLDGLYNIPG